MIPNRRESAMATFFRKPDRRPRFLLPVECRTGCPKATSSTGARCGRADGPVLRSRVSDGRGRAGAIRAGHDVGGADLRLRQRPSLQPQGGAIVLARRGLPDDRRGPRAGPQRDRALPPTARRTGAGGVRRGAAAVSGRRSGAPGRGRAGRHEGGGQCGAGGEPHGQDDRPGGRGDPGRSRGDRCRRGRPPWRAAG